MIVLQFWFWFLTTTVALGAIAISSFVVINLKLNELDAAFRDATSNDHTT